MPESGAGAAASDLYRGFEAYRTVQQDDYRQVLLEGLVVPDTNVLLNLYRYTPGARADLVAVLEKLGDRLWVPNEVLVEFWRNRESAINDPRDSAEAAAEALAAQLDQAQRAVRTWGNRAAAPREHVQDLSNNLDSAIQSVVDSVTGSVDERELEKRRNTQEDVVLRALEPIVQGRVGNPLGEAEHAAAVTEGLRRAQERIPPGFADRTKGDDRAAGDYIIWEQIMLEAATRHDDVLFVTGDVKNDWWRIEHGEARGPRLELVDELRQRAGVSLYMIRPESLLRLGEKFLMVNVREESLKDAERIASALGGIGGGWSEDALTVALKRLDARGPVQAAAVRAAIRRGGFVPRHVVYQLGNYSDDRTLRGFTRPANTISQELRDEGLIPTTAQSILEAVYDPAFSYVQASGFSVPRELVSARDLIDGAAADDSLPSGAPPSSASDSVTITFRDRNGDVHTIDVPTSLASVLSSRLHDPSGNM